MAVQHIQKWPRRVTFASFLMPLDLVHPAAASVE
jgi:hypothetical protein